MLRKESVTDALWNLLLDLQKSEVFKDYFLVGGTSLALQMGHRISVDIDLFTRKEVDKDSVFAFFDKNYKGYETIRRRGPIVQVPKNSIFTTHNWERRRIIRIMSIIFMNKFCVSLP